MPEWVFMGCLFLTGMGVFLSREMHPRFRHKALLSVVVVPLVVMGLSACGVATSTQDGSTTVTVPSSKAQQKQKADPSHTSAVQTQGSGQASDSSIQASASMAKAQANAESGKQSDPSTSDSSGNLTQSAETKQTPKGLIPVVVAKNVDGDTIHVTMPSGKEEDVRMLLIDTPEDVSPSKPVEPFGYTAANYAKSVLPVGKKIYIEEGVKGYTRDKYGRLLAFIYRTPTDLYNLDVVKKGYARVAYVYPPNTQHLTSLKSAESYAKSHKLGIWSMNGYVTSSGYNLSIACQYAETHNYTTHGCSSGTASKSSTATSSKRSTNSASASSTDSVSSSGSDQLRVHPGDEATVSVKTTPNTEGSIEVDYKSGPSHAKGLDPKKSDQNGVLSWSWFVGTHTTPGTYNVILTIGSKTITKHLIVN